MSRALSLLVLASLVACTSQFLPGRCDKTSDCAAGQTCNLDRTPEGNGRCVSMTAPDGAAGDGGSEDAKADAPKTCPAVPCSAATAPICDAMSKACRGCASVSECTMLSAAASICDPSGKCVECGASTDCSSAAKPICGPTTNTCKACSTNDECAARGSAAPVCAASGTCVECTAHSQCGAAGKPICDTMTSACRGCASGAECAEVSAATPACASSGKCVECAANTDCKSATKPICDMGTNTCRGCQADAECTAGPQVCMKHQDGRCATDAETIYVQKTAACPGAAATVDGTAAMPYCSMDPAVGVVGATRDLIVVRGTVSSATTGLSYGARQISIVGQMSAALAGAEPAFHLVAGDAYLRNVKLSTGASIGCQADAGATLRLDHVLVASNSGGGILLNGAAFDIENTTVTTNGPGTEGATTWGGILVNAPPAAGPAKLQLVTVQNNMGGGIACSAAVSMASGILATGNTVPDVNATCGFLACGTASTTCGAQP